MLPGLSSISTVKVSLPQQRVTYRPQAMSTFADRQMPSANHCINFDVGRRACHRRFGNELADDGRAGHRSRHHHAVGFRV